MNVKEWNEGNYMFYQAWGEERWLVSNTSPNRDISTRGWHEVPRWWEPV